MSKKIHYGLCNDAHDYFKSLGRDKKLLDMAVAELDFLQLIDKYPFLYGGAVLDNAIRRYECFWLPLLAKESMGEEKRGKYRDEFSLLTAPIDVAWVWHLHMLAPLAYKQDCESMFGGLLDSEYLARNHSVGRNLWQQSYPDEPFDLDLTTAPPYLQQYKSQLKYNLQSAAERQSKFYYNVSLPHYRDTKFLKDAVERYKHHLNLKGTNPRIFLVPCYDFDLIWHAHQLCPEKYHQDMTAILGYVLNHDDTETSRVPGTKLYESEILTRVAWKQAGLEFSKRGAMHRGKPLPKGPLWQPGIFKRLATFEVELMKITTHLNKKKKIQITITSPSGIEVRKVVKGGEMSFGNHWFPLLSGIKANSAEETSFTTILFHKRLFGKNALQHSEISLKAFLNSLENPNQTFPAQCTKTIYFNKGVVELLFRVVKPPTLGNFEFDVVPEENFIKVNHVAQVLSQPMLMLSQKNIEMASLPGEMTTNQIKDHRGQVVFTCKIVHSADCMLSAVEILDIHSCNIAATAHVLDTGALPEPNEVSSEGLGSSCVTVAGREGARAMLIRSRDQDYGICVGKWIKKEVTSKDGWRKKISFMGLKYYSLNEDAQGRCKVKKFKNSKFLLVLRPSSSQVQMKVDLNQGHISVLASAAEDIPQCLAVSFAVAVLHLLCRPYKPKEDQSSAPLSRQMKIDNHVAGAVGTTVRRRSLSNSSCILYTTPCMMLAAGYCCMTVPTNVYLHLMGKIGWDFRSQYYDTIDLKSYDCDGEWGGSIGFDEQGDEWEDSLGVGYYLDGADNWGDRSEFGYCYEDSGGNVVAGSGVGRFRGRWRCNGTGGDGDVDDRNDGDGRGSGAHLVARSYFGGFGVGLGGNGADNGGDDGDDGDSGDGGDDGDGGGCGDCGGCGGCGGD